MFFTVGETNLFVWRLWFLAALLSVAPAITLYRVGVSPPYLLTVAYLLGVVALVASRAAQSGADWSVKMRLGLYISPGPLIVSGGHAGLVQDFLLMGATLIVYFAIVGWSPTRAERSIEDAER